MLSRQLAELDGGEPGRNTSGTNLRLPAVGSFRPSVGCTRIGTEQRCCGSDVGRWRFAAPDEAILADAEALLPIAPGDRLPGVVTGAEIR